MATERVDHVGATFNGERTSGDDGEWAGAREVGGRRSVGNFDQKRGRQPRPQLYAAGAGFKLPLHAPDQRMYAADGAMADYGAATGWCGAVMGRAILASTGLGPGAATGYYEGVAPADAEGPNCVGSGHAVIHRTHTCTSHQSTRDRQRIGSWTDETLHAAMDKITDEGMKLKVATKIFGIPSSSLRDHLYGRTTCRQRGTKPTLKTQEEKKLVDYVFKMQVLGHPLTPLELRLKVAIATQTREMPWSASGLPRTGWLRRFRNRHPEIASRRS